MVNRCFDDGVTSVGMYDFSGDVGEEQTLCSMIPLELQCGVQSIAVLDNPFLCDEGQHCMDSGLDPKNGTLRRA